MMRLFPLGRRCGMGTHVLSTRGMRLQTPTPLDLRIAWAGASDPTAQRWLGWKPESIVPEPDRQRLLGIRVGRDGRGFQVGGKEHMLVAVDPAMGRLIGYASCDMPTAEVGGWLAPEYRGRGLGAALFGCVAELGHRHLGFTTVIAGAETTNRASIGALTAAGFTPMPGPETHTLPNGREIAGSWFRHDCDRPGHCTW